VPDAPVNPLAAAAAWLGAFWVKRPWLQPITAAVATIVAALCFADPNIVRGIVGGAALLVAVLPEAAAAWWRARLRADETDAAAEQILVLKSALRPLAEMTATLVNERAGSQSNIFGRIIQHAVGAAVLPFATDVQARAVIFVVSSDQTRMTAAAHTGRDQRPGDFVRRLDKRGAKAFEILESRRPVFVRDLKKGSPRTWAGSGSGYRTFITVPIVDGTGGYGLLTLDAPEPGVLTKTDQLLLELLAEMLSVVFASVSIADSPH